MCQEIFIDNQELTRNDNTCWCPLQDTPTKFENLTPFQQAAFTEFGHKIWVKLNAEKHPGCQTWSTEISLKRW